jgi:hypothetical protein
VLKAATNRSGKESGKKEEMPTGKHEVKQPVHRFGVVLALMVACLGGPAVATPVGSVETFEGNAVGSFPSGWSDVAAVDPDPIAPKPSAVVVSATNAFGNQTKSLAPVPTIGGNQGIYRVLTYAPDRYS